MREPGRVAIALAILAATIALAWRMETSRDLGFHILAGRWILEHGAWPKTDAFTWTLAGRPYIDMNGLFQVLLALAHRAGGLVGVGVLRVSLALATFGVLWWSTRKVENPALVGIGFALALLVYEVRLFTRPELISGLCLAVQLYLLKRHTETDDRRYLFATVPLQLVWVYSHSLSMFGLAVLGLYAVTRFRDPAPWIALGLACAVMFLNPYGLRGLQWQMSLGSRIAAGNPFADTQEELVSPFSTDAQRFPALIYFRILVVVAALILWRMPRFDGAVVVLFGTLAAVHMRIVAMFAIAALPAILEAAPKRPLPKLVPVALAALLFLTQQTISGGLYDSNRYPFRFGHAESAAVFPTGTVDSPIEGPLFNAIEHGGYLELHGKKTFVDGRLEVMDEEFFLAYLRALDGDGWDALQERWHPTVALVPANDRELVKRLLGDRSWALVDVDSVSFLFARQTPDHARAIEARQERLRQLDTPAEKPDDAIVPPPPKSWLARVFGRRNVAFAAFGRGANFLQLGMYEAARRDLREAILNTDQPQAALLKSYVIASARAGRLDEARTWCARLVEVAPQDEDARALFATLKQSGS